MRNRRGAWVGAMLGAVMGTPLLAVGLLLSLLFGVKAELVRAFLADTVRAVALLSVLHLVSVTAGFLVGATRRPRWPEGRRKGHLVLVKGTGKRSRQVS